MMTNTNISVNIERLVLDGISIPHHHRPLLQAAVEEELTRLLAAGGLSSSMMTGGAIPQMLARDIQLAGESDVSHLGQQIAQAVYSGIGR